VNAFDSAKKNKAKYFAVKVFIPGNTRDEVIINHSKSFDTKLQYYLDSYSENLLHKNNSGVKITGFTYGNSFYEIERDLLV
jgi:hypothetical protein